MPDRFPGYDVLAKRNTPSWNDKTREVIDRRLRIPNEPRFFTAAEFATVDAVADRIVPQPADRARVPVAALVDEKMYLDRQDGYRAPDMPRQGEAWRRGLRALDAEAEASDKATFVKLSAAQQDAPLTRLRQGETRDPAWEGMSPVTFWHQRLARDIVFAYWSHPVAWNEIGWGGPASPRGYVRMGYNERDPWEAAEAHDGHEHEALRRNRHVG